MIKIDSKVLSANVSMFEMYTCEKDYNISGVLVNRHYRFLIRFEGVRQMINSLETLFNQLNFPMAAMEERHFKEKSEDQKMLPNMREMEDGEYETEPPNFVIHVQFRQGSTWQGTLQWVAKKKTKRFRSELELMGLLMEAMEFDSGIRSQKNKIKE